MGGCRQKGGAEVGPERGADHSPASERGRRFGRRMTDEKKEPRGRVLGIRGGMVARDAEVGGEQGDSPSTSPGLVRARQLCHERLLAGRRRGQRRFALAADGRRSWRRARPFEGHVDRFDGGFPERALGGPIVACILSTSRKIRHWRDGERAGAALRSRKQARSLRSVRSVPPAERSVRRKFDEEIGIWIEHTISAEPRGSSTCGMSQS